MTVQNRAVDGSSQTSSPIEPTKNTQHTGGEWRAVALGGSSTVISTAKPARNDNRIPPYAYDEAQGHCIAYPFLGDDGRPRLDFVCFSHEDARLIASAPELLEALKATTDAINAAIQLGMAEAQGHDRTADRLDRQIQAARALARAAILRAESR